MILWGFFFYSVTARVDPSYRRHIQKVRDSQNLVTTFDCIDSDAGAASFNHSVPRVTCAIYSSIRREFFLAPRIQAVPSCIQRRRRRLIVYSLSRTTQLPSINPCVGDDYNLLGGIGGDRLHQKCRANFI